MCDVNTVTTWFNNLNTLSFGLVIAGAIGVVVLLAALCFCYCCKKSNKGAPVQQPRGRGRDQVELQDRERERDRDERRAQRKASRAAEQRNDEAVARQHSALALAAVPDIAPPPGAAPSDYSPHPERIRRNTDVPQSPPPMVQRMPSEVLPSYAAVILEEKQGNLNG